MMTGKVRNSRSVWGAQTGSAYRVRCSDGKIRVAIVTAEADTFWTLPARVRVRGKTVAGHIYTADPYVLGETEDPAAEIEYRFTAYAYRKNGALLPAWGRQPAPGTLDKP